MGLKSSKTDKHWINRILTKHEPLVNTIKESADSFDVLYNALLIEDEDKRIQTLRTLIESGVDVNSCWTWNECNTSMPRYASEGLTVLMEAVRKGHVDCVQMLLDAGANVNQSDEYGQTALIKSAIKGHGECIRLLLEAGADVDQSNVYDETALTYAASNESDECVRLLIEAGANVNLADEYNTTALMITARYGYVQCARLLLEAGADVNGVNTRGYTALICCLNCYIYSKGKACLKLLIDAGSDIDVNNNKSLQPIHYALMCWQRATFPVEYLISENCNLNQASYDLVEEATIDKYHYSKYPLQEAHKLDMLKLLFACGLPRQLCQSFIIKQETSVRHWIDTVASKPNTLKSICVFKIRRNLGLGIKSKVTKLNLPIVIQNLILLRGILSLECFI